ncbi:radical SAM family heme chaperone HemW [candidate division WOR-3 bacterium]|nr:radical SAM family heme chaperone HemW [candidate division WOR-3 bacterium]
MTDFYVHVPLCVKKCPYCNFTSFPSTDNRISQYLSGFHEELSRFKPASRPRTLHVGGGTPNILRGKNAIKFFSELEKACLTNPAQEFALELNPELVDEDYIRFLTAESVTRLSLGVQSLNDKKLKFLGRIHDSKKGFESYKILRSSRAKSVSVDFIFGVPGEDEKSLAKDLKMILSLESDHISAYMLTIEKDCLFYKKTQSGELKLPDEKKSLSLFKLVGETLQDAGYERYETSNFRKDFIFRSVHNSHIWEGKDYIGFGPGSVSRVGLKRWRNSSDLFSYSKGEISKDEEEISEEDRMLEILMTGLRTKVGIRKGLFQKLDFEKISSFIHEGYLKFSKTRCYITEDGIPLTDEITAALSPMV